MSNRAKLKKGHVNMKQAFKLARKKVGEMQGSGVFSRKYYDALINKISSDVFIELCKIDLANAAIGEKANK